MHLRFWLIWGLALTVPAAAWAQGAFPPDPPADGQGVPPIKQPSPDDAAPEEIPAPNQEASSPADPEATASRAAGVEKADVPTKTLEVAPGDNLALLSEKAYGSAGYWRILKLYNEVDPTRLRVGESIEAPDLMALLQSSGMLPLFEDAVGALMKGRQAYTEVETALRKEEESADAYAIEETEKEKLEEASGQITACLEALGDRREGVTGVPASTIQQLRTAVSLIDEIAAGEVTSSKLTEVHERLGNALTYAILWAREGFK